MVISHWVRFRKWFLTIKCFAIAVLAVSMIAILAFTTYTLKKVFPETELVLNSKCKNPYANWDGKILDVPVYTNGYLNRPSFFNIHNELDYEETSESPKYTPQVGDKPIIIWGTHHKTGTFVAKKLFAKICAKMQWCCLFHVTRDSIHAVKNSLATEQVDVLGHNQWVWDPASLGIANYRFIHLYRHPFKKVVSGYRYHFDGIEKWTQKHKKFTGICKSELVQTVPSPVARHDSAYQMSSSSSSSSAQTNHSGRYSHHLASRSAVFDFCQLTYLCETCCRAEHEVRDHHLSGRHSHNHTVNSNRHRTATRNKHMRTQLRRVSDEIDDRSNSINNSNSNSNSGSNSHQIVKSDTFHAQQYMRRSELEYGFMCRHLDGLSGSLQEALQRSSAESGILTEAALDFYENLRMARLVNQTAADPRSLNLDLDELNHDFSASVWRILTHLKDVIPESQMAELHEELLFYDLQSSPIYRWSMGSVNHIDTSNHVHSSEELMALLQNNDEVQQLYAPVFRLMSGVVKPGRSKSLK